MFVAAVSAGCGQDGAGRARAADLDEVLLSNGGPRLMAMDVRTCASRTLPVSGVRPDSVAFTRDHRTVATLREIEQTGSGTEASHLGAALQEGLCSEWDDLVLVAGLVDPVSFLVQVEPPVVVEVTVAASCWSGSWPRC